MTDATGSPAGGEAFHSVPLPADAPETFASTNEAAAYYASLLDKKPEKQAAESAEPEKDATAETESSQEDAAPETDPGEDAPDADPAEVPPIERPRSWTKDVDDVWQSLPRPLQEKVAAREQERERELRRSQNETAEKLKGLTAKEQQAEQARQQYEAQLPALMQTLQDAQQSSFADIRTVDDVTKLANEDPFRYLQWQAHQTKLQAVNAENERVNREKQTAQQSEWTSFVQKENELAAEFIPELADKTKGPALTQRVATELLPELGFKDSELADLASGKQKLSIYDHRVQRLLADAVKLRDIQSATKAVAATPLPPVQRPGTARPAGEIGSERLQALNRKSELTVNEANELYTLQQATTRRRAS